MADPMVLAAQQWLNTTYGSVAGYTPCVEDGLTGQQTIDRIIMGLQHEMGISPVVDSLGPTTWSLMKQYGTISATHTTTNRTKLLQCALYCKGYDGDAISGTWTDNRTGDALKALQTDMGHTSTAASVTPKQFRALLNTDAFVLLPTGIASIRTAQQWLNRTYIAKTNYLYCPTDGVFNRNTQTAFVMALQYDLGQTDAQADGQYGPGTASQLQASAAVAIQIGTTDSTKRWVRLFKCLMLFNQSSTTFDGTFTSADSLSVQRFQGFSAFTSAELTGKGDFRTWSEFLVSTGDPNRTGTAADMASTITVNRATSLVAAGYKTVGRYLTNFQAPGALDKNIKPGELTTILNAGLSIFPIFEEGGDEASWFTYNQGVTDAGRAHQAATGYGFPAGTIIYFAVDFDAIDEEIDFGDGPAAVSVLSYFQGVRKGLNTLASPYTVGVYGTRNVCARVCAPEVDLAISSFIAGLSTGWSGNLGFRLPANWAFNQIQNLTIGTGTGAVEIDKNVKSGRDNGVTSLSTPVDPNKAIFDYVDWVQTKAHDYLQTHTSPFGYTESFLTAQYLRYPKFQGEYWTGWAGPLDYDWINWMDGLAVPLLRSYVEPAFKVGADMYHLAGAINSTMFLGSVESSKNTCTLMDMTNWAGDILSLFRLAGWQNTRPGYTSTLAWARALINANENVLASGYGRVDFSQDASAYNIGRTIWLAPTTSFAALFKSTYKVGGTFPNRYSSFYTSRFNSTQATALAAAKDLFFSTVPAIVVARGQIANDDTFNLSQLTTTDKNQTAQAFVEALIAAAS